MAKPPSTPPHSDLDGVHEDEPKVQNAAGQGDPGAELQRAADQDAARPDLSVERSRDDRS